MSDRDTSGRTRRQFLAGVSGASAVGLAGCGMLNDGPGGNGDGPACADGYEVTFDVPGEPVSPTGEGRLPAPTLGPADASVTVAVYEDYACPHCKDFSLETFPGIKCEYVDPGEIRYEFHDFPIPVSSESKRAASAARAVQDTVGNGAFWSYSKALFENQGSLGPSTYADLAGSVGADPEVVRTAAVETQYADTVQADRSAGVERGVQGTPTVFVNGALVEATYDAISQAIDEER